MGTTKVGRADARRIAAPARSRPGRPDQAGAPSRAARIAAGVGNRSAAALLREHGPVALLQRQPRGERASTSVPGLSHRDVAGIERVRESDPQAALNLLVDALARRGSIDPAFLVDARMNAITDTSRMRRGHFGNTSLSPGTERPRPCRVDIGPDAFRSVGELYATVMHEWQHVLQFRRNTTSSEAANEVEARLWEVEHMRESGMRRDPAYTISLRTQLSVWWRRLSTDEQPAFEARYRTALETLAEAQMAQQTGPRR